MNSNSATHLVSMNLPAGTWMIFGNAIFTASGTLGFVQAGISYNSGSFDTLSYIIQVNNSAFLPAPMRYYSGAAKTIYLMGVSGGVSVNSNLTTSSSVLRAAHVA